MEKKVDLRTRKSAFVELKDFCIFSMGDIKRKDDYLEVTEWSNGEGYDIYISTKDELKLQLTWGQFHALKKCIKKIEKN
jgi:hypothetical protein